MPVNPVALSNTATTATCTRKKTKRTVFLSPADKSVPSLPHSLFLPALSDQPSRTDRFTETLSPSALCFPPLKNPGRSTAVEPLLFQMLRLPITFRLSIICRETHNLLRGVCDFPSDKAFLKRVGKEGTWV